MKVIMFKITTFQGWSTTGSERHCAITEAGRVAGTNLFTNALPGDRVVLQKGVGYSWGEYCDTDWVMVGPLVEEEAESEAEVLAATLVKCDLCGDALRCAHSYDFGGLVFIINAVEGETKARLLGLVSDVASLLRRDSRWVLPR
jgi:hypothetical protein